MSRPVSYNVNSKPLEIDISMVDMPEGHVGEGFFATSLDKVVGLARKNSIWPLPFATSCCGIESHGEARQPMAIKYFLVAILFVLFDVEVIFFYPYAVNFKALGWAGFWAVMMFVAFFLCGFIYIIKKNALKWEE